MTDTETRLRDYLQTKAATVPDDAEPPGLDEPVARRRIWPVLAAAATIAAVVAVPVVSKLTAEPPAVEPAAKPGLRVPYAVMANPVTLHDGDVTLPLDDTMTSFRDSARVDGGWVILHQDKESRTYRLGLLRPTGDLTPFGPGEARGFEVSPDHRQVVTATSAGGGRTRLVTLDIATGNEVNSLVVPYGSITPRGWNSDGVWLIEEYSSKVPPVLWKPGTDQFTQLQVDDYAANLFVGTASDRVMAVTQKGSTTCLRAGTARDGQLAVDAEYCAPATERRYAGFSPDGATIVNLDHRVAVTGGRTTKLALPAGALVGPPVFEDATHLLATLDGKPAGHLGSVQEVFYRCDVTRGACEAVYTAPADTWVRLGQP
ncbi:hypothetical protein [Kribbella lupini]|uniref:WD40 repeat protein n=1 Tax=Kribbella lupini TaxID=291602 RepID=A0ABN2A0T2_9ACTN